MDKPAGVTSHDVVARVRRRLKVRSVGHTGTLDPFATGLLVLLTGRATRLAKFVEGQAKTYRATARLGLATDTDDLDGRPTGDPVPVAVDRAEVEAAVAALAGTRLQRPPAYSAKKVAGVRSYRLARQGRAVALAPVEVTVHAAVLLDYHAPDLDFRVTVSPGTYVRALARDLGERLGTGAHLRALRRERVGPLQVADALAPEAVTAEAVLPPLAVLGHLPAAVLSEEERQAVRHGRAIAGGGAEGGEVALVAGGTLVAVARSEGGRLHPVVVLEAE